MQHDGGLASIAVVQQDEDLEDIAGKIQLLWLYTDTMVEGDSWTRGQVSVRADTVQDIIQNYTVRIQRSVFTWTPYCRGIPGQGVRYQSGPTLSKISYRLQNYTVRNQRSVFTRTPWTSGQVSVRADTVQDIIQNYTVRIQQAVFTWTP